MRTIKKSDIIFNLDTKHVYVQDFNAKFFTVNETDYYIDYSSADVVTTEKEGEIIYSLNLDWKRLRNVGKGVLIFKCINNIPDEDFPDGSYNNEYKVTTDYYIDTFEVEPEEHESVIELIEEETENRISGDTFLSGAIDTLDTKVENYKEETDAAISAETDNRISGDTFLSGAIDTLDTKVENYKEETDNAISAETDNRIAADGVLSAAVDTLDAKVESYKGEIDEAITGLENALQEEASARSAADTYLSGAIDTLDTKVETYKTATDTAISAETDSRISGDTILSGAIDTLDTKVENYKTATDAAISAETDNRIAADGVISGALDSHSADTSLHFSGVEKENLDSLATNIAAISGITSGDVEQWNKQFDDAKYEMSGQTHVINFYHGNVIKATIDATDFIVDGMVENVVISGGNLVITFNTDSGKQPITIPLTDIFDPSNYYTKTETDTLLSAKADTSAVTEAITAAVSGKADTSAVTEAITAAVSGKQDTLVSGTNIKTINNESILGSGNIDIQGGGSNVISLAQSEYDALETIDPDALYVISDATEVDMLNYYTKTETNTLLSAKANTATTYTKTEVDEMFDNIDLSDYYTKEETDGIVSGKADLSYVEDVEETVARAINDLNDSISGKADTSAVTEAITAAVSGKQDTLVSGTNIKTINNTSILGSGNIDIQGGGVNVVQTTGTSTTDVMSQDAVTNIQQNLIINYTNGSDGQGRTYLMAYKANGRGNDNLSILATKINGKNIIVGGYSNRNGIPVGLSLVETSAITTSVTSASTDSQVPSAKAVYDAIQEGGGSITVDSALSKTSENPVQNKVLYNKIDEMEQVTAAAINALNDDVSGKQDTLVSGTNIKTINNESILGSGNITIGGGSSYTAGSGIDITNDVISVTGKVDTNTYTAYTAATETALAGKADTATTYTKTEVDTALAAKADTATTYTKTETDTLLSAKADTATTYTKSEVNTALAGKADTSRLGGLSLVQLTQAEYDALATKDSNTLYVIVG